MSGEERASREGPWRRSGPARDSGDGAGAPLTAADLAAALQDSVCAIGASGPPRAGLSRIRRRAKARQRRRHVAAGGAGVLVLAMVVSVLTGNSFNIVPTLTSMVGLGGGSPKSGTEASASPDYIPGQVRTVRPPAAATGKLGPAIGPAAVAATPTALAATGVAQCTATQLTTVAQVDSVIGGVSYGHVEAVAQSECAVAGPPMLKVANAAGNAAGSVVILQHTSADGSLLPAVPTWGTVLVLQSGQGYDFQFAWAPDQCQGATGGGTGPSGGGTSSSASAGGGSGTAGAPAATAGYRRGASAAQAVGDASSENAYSLSYLIADVTPTAPVNLAAACGATVYVTDIYPAGSYPAPTTATATPVTPSAAPSSTSSTPGPSQTSTLPTPPPSTPATTGSASSTPTPTATDVSTGSVPAAGPGASDPVIPPDRPSGT